jgi:hypothetical protein
MLADRSWNVGADDFNASASTPALISTADWTIAIPVGAWADISADTCIIEANNSNPLDPNKAHSYVNPMGYAIESGGTRPWEVDQRAASADDFANAWVQIDTLTTSAYQGSGCWRYVRIRNLDDELNASFSAFIWSYHRAPMV